MQRSCSSYNFSDPLEWCTPNSRHCQNSIAAVSYSHLFELPINPKIQFYAWVYGSIRFKIFLVERNSVLRVNIEQFLALKKGSVDTSNPKQARQPSNPERYS